jgi:hypothetical protein
MNGDPTVTICIPSYNHARFLEGAVTSVLGQTYTNLECLVFDDGSTDDSREIVRSLQMKDSRVRLLSHEDGQNHGIAATLNGAYRNALGLYVAHLAADDTIQPDSVERQVALLRSDPDLDFVYGRVEMLDADGRSTGIYGGFAAESMFEHDKTTDPLQALLLHNYIQSPTVLMRSALFETVGGFEDRTYYTDWEMWIRLMARGARFAFVEGGPLVMCRPGAYGAEFDLPRRLDLFRTLSAKVSAVGGRLEEPRIRALICLQAALQAIQLEEENEARDWIRSAFVADPGLRAEGGYLFWLVGPLLRQRLRDAEQTTDGRWIDTLAGLNATVGEVISAGARAGSLPCWVVEAARAEMTPGALERLSWAVIGNEIELGGSRLSPKMLGVGLARALRSPRLLRDSSFLKVLLCTAGLWPLAVRARGSISRG